MSKIDSVVCKLMCHHNAPSVHDTEGKVSIRLGGVYANYEADKLTENAMFGKYTPIAEFQMCVTNENVPPFFEVGKKYYLTFTPAPD